MQWNVFIAGIEGNGKNSRYVQVTAIHRLIQGITGLELNTP